MVDTGSHLYFFLCRASELNAYSSGKIHKEFRLTIHFSFFLGTAQLTLPA